MNIVKLYTQNITMKKIVEFCMFAILIMLGAININHFSSTSLIAPNINAFKDAYVKVEDNKIDDTVFKFKYKNKIWEYKVENDNLKSQQFDIDFELNKYNKKNKQQKIIIINYMKKLGFNNEIIINYLFPNLLNKINKIKLNIEKYSKNAEFKLVSDNNIKIIKEIIGVKLNYNLLLNNILNNYEHGKIINLNIPVNYIKPEIVSEDLKKCTNLRASFSTGFSNSISDRKHNIRQATKEIDGIILEKNEEFSFNKVVGKRTADNGYKVAKIIYNGSFIDGVGGGVCQVSSTLYNAVLMAGLRVEKSNKHSERIGYVKAGFDAMVNYGSSDLVFVNNTNNKIFISAKVKSDRLYISIFGEELNGYEYKLRSEEVDVIPCIEEEIKVDEKGEYLDKVVYSDESFYLKKATNGCTIKSYRDIYCNGEKIKSELLRTDKYLPQHAVKIIGAKKRPFLEILMQNDI